MLEKQLSIARRHTTCRLVAVHTETVVTSEEHLPDNDVVVHEREMRRRQVRKEIKEQWKSCRDSRNGRVDAVTTLTAFCWHWLRICRRHLAAIASIACRCHFPSRHERYGDGKCLMTSFVRLTNHRFALLNMWPKERKIDRLNYGSSESDSIEADCLHGMVVVSGN